MSLGGTPCVRLGIVPNARGSVNTPSGGSCLSCLRLNFLMHVTPTYLTNRSLNRISTMDPIKPNTTKPKSHTSQLRI